ncbi:DUF1758 domain-containing protein [Trichonephila clavipes]|nr:DUF1758 domain-containing protein [Trichonephila clavipes]
MREDACVRTCQPDYIWSEKLKDLSIADVGSITRISTFMDNVSEHVDITELEVKLKKIDQLQRKIEELKELLFGLETAKPTEEAEFEEDLYKCETRLDDLERKRRIFVTEKITGLTPSVTLDVSEIKIPEFLELSDPYFYEAKEIHALLNADIFFRIIKDNVYKVNKELLFRETEFGWIAGGRLQGTNTNNFSCYFLKDNDSVDDTLKLFFELESLDIKDDPCYRKDDQAMNIFKETVQYNNNRLNRVAISSDIRQAFLQICLADKHKDFVRFLWTDSNPRIGEKLTLQVYRFNRVIFGVNSSPFLLAATIKYHIEKYNEIHPITVQHLDSFMYVDDWITGQDTREEALFMSRHAKNIMKESRDGDAKMDQQ